MHRAALSRYASARRGPHAKHGDRRGIASRHKGRLVVYQLRALMKDAERSPSGRLADRCAASVVQIQRWPLRCAAALARAPRQRAGPSRLSLGAARPDASSRSARPDRRFAAAGWCARLNQLAGGLALCVLPSKNGNRGDSTERAAHGPGLAAGAGFRGTMVRSLEKAGADIKLVTVATLRSTRRQRRRAAGDAGRPRRGRGAATIGVALRNRG